MSCRVPRYARYFLLIVSSITCTARAQNELPKVSGIELQPLQAQVQRIAQALDFLGQPLTAAQSAALDAAMRDTDSASSVSAIQDVLDPLWLIGVNINAEIFDGRPLLPALSGLAVEYRIIQVYSRDAGRRRR